MLLGVTLAGTAVLWAPAARELHVASDDRDMMAVSRRVAAGEWRRLFDFHDVHVLPLFRLVRLPFDLGFPRRFPWMFGVLILAQAASVALLFHLSRHYLQSAWAALATAVFFAWHTLGAEAVIIRSQNTYVLLLPWLLGTLALLIRGQTAAAFLALVTAGGLSVVGTLAAIPGVLGAALLLAPDSGRRRAAWIACGAAGALAGGVWLTWGPVSQRPALLRDGLLPRLVEGAVGSALHFGFLVRHTPPNAGVIAGAALILVALLVGLRASPARRWTLAGVTFAAAPVFVILALRSRWGYQTSRYCYPSAVAVAVALGSAVDLGLRAAAGRALARRGLLAALVAAALVYYLNERAILNRTITRLRFTPSVSREFWLGWATFFDETASRARAASVSFRLPAVEFEPTLRIAEVLALTDPRGKQGITVLRVRESTTSDCASFWYEVGRVQKVSPVFARTPLPGSLTVLPPGAAWPGPEAVVCRAGQ